MSLFSADSSNFVQHCSFNASEDLFVAATKQGFNIYRTDPFAQTTQRSIPGGLLIAELLESTNFMAVVPRGSPDTVQIWDDRMKRVFAELPFESVSPVRSVKLRRDVLVCVLVNQIRVYSMKAKPTLIHEYQTVDNPKGLLALSGGSDIVLAFPARKAGRLQIVNLGTGDPVIELWSGKPKHLIISSHSGEINCIAINAEGTLVATASVTGTLIRIWRTSNGQQATEFRRGIDHADIQSMSFSRATHMLPRLAVVSDKETVHIFNLPVNGNENVQGNKSSAFSGLASLGIASGYFGSVWSVHKATIGEIPAQHPNSTRVARRFLVAWLSDRAFVVLGSDGGYWKYLIPEYSKAITGEVSECSQESYRIWIPRN